MHAKAAKWTAAFKRENEDVNLVITTANTQEAIIQFTSYKSDLAIYGDGISESPEEVTWEQLLEDELWFVVAPNHPFANQTISLAQMVEMPGIHIFRGVTGTAGCDNLI